MSKTRLESFSDGVIAIAITLLVLNIDVPPVGHPGSLGHKLLEQWPSYAAYATSFLTIGIIWINHHLMISRLRAVSHEVLFLNLLLLLFIGILPWSTALMADYLRAGSGSSLAAAVYGASLLTMAISFYVLQRHILFGRHDLLRKDVDERQRASINSRNRAGLLPYLIATPLAFVSPYITLAISAALAVFYALPLRIAQA
jgi:TMEM175 potassium channel family protein